MPMTSITHPVLGEIEYDAEDTENTWETEIELDGRTVTVDVTFDGAAIDEDELDGVARFVSDAGRFERLARQAMRESWDEYDEDEEDEDFGARTYAEHHAEELDMEELADADTFFSRLYLTRIGVEADDPERHAVFDYSIGPELTQYLLVVVFNSDGEVTEVVMES